MRCLERRFDLRRGIREYFRIWIGGTTSGVARMCEKVGGAPEQMCSSPCHVLFGMIRHGVEIGLRLGEGLALRGDIAVMKAEEWDAQLGDKLECGIHLGPRRGNRICRGRQPGS